MLPLSDLLLGILLPALLSGVVLLVVPRRLAAALAVGGGYVAGQLGLRGWRGWVPRESTDWLLVVAVVGTVVGAAGMARGRASRMLAPVLALALGWRLIEAPLTRWHGSLAATGLLLLGAVLAAVAWWLLARETAAPPGERSLALVIAVSGGALAIGLSGSATLAQLTGALAAALGAVAVLQLVGRTGGTPTAAAPVVGLLLAALLAVASVYSELPPGAALLVFGSALVQPLFGAAARTRPRPVPLLLVVGLAAAAVIVANASSPSWDGVY